MTFSPRAIEAAARAIDKLDHRKAKSMADLTRMMAEAALSAALAVDGLALVPKEPTEAMIEAGEKISCASARDNCAMIYDAMLSAASPPSRTEG